MGPDWRSGVSSKACALPRIWPLALHARRRPVVVSGVLGRFQFFYLSIAAERSRVPATLWRIFHEPTSSALGRVDSCRGGMSDLPTLRGCCGRANPDQGAD